MSRKLRQLEEMRDTDAALAAELAAKLEGVSGSTSPSNVERRKADAEKEEARRKRKEKYATKHKKDADDVVFISEEQRLRAMLGYGWSSDGDKPDYLFMEYICACCGTEHKAPHLLDAYYLCAECQNVLREPSVLRKRWANIEPECKLEICYATYGDFEEPTLAYAVTSVLQARVDEIYYRDRLHMRKTADLAAWFVAGGVVPPQWPSGDPCPGRNKQLKVRYRMLGLHGTLNLDVNPDNHLSSNFMMIAPTEKRYLAIIHATYGHPKGQSPQGRMSVEVTEVVQGLVDMVGGSYLSISYMASAKRYFGDPCPGYPKDLRIKFEIAGREGVVLCDEMRGFLRQRCQIEYAPTIQPLIFCAAATWGISPTGRKMRLDQVVNLLRKIGAIEHRQSNGAPPTKVEKLLLLQKADLLKERIDLQTSVTSFVDIREKIQRMCDKAGRCFELNKDRFDPNYTFGNILKGRPKILEISLESPGHDAERVTDSIEMTKSGHPRNFITNKSARIAIVCKDREDGKGYMNESLIFRTDLAAPVISISRATYGFLKDPRFVVDVTLEVQAQVVDRKLRIPTDMPLDKIFVKDPCPGIRKQLKVEYVTRGFIGAVRVREVNDGWISNVELGYPPVPLEDA